MSHRLWRCRNPGCATPHGTVLGRVMNEGVLVLDPAIATFRCYLDTRRVVVACPSCGVAREFRGKAVLAEGRYWPRSR